MRLIDADKVIKELNDYIKHRNSYDNEDIQKQRETKIGNKMIEGCIGAIREQPTAYDVDKVLEQLEYSRVPNTGIAGYHKVVEIVKGGGVND